MCAVIRLSSIVTAVSVGFAILVDSRVIIIAGEFVLGRVCCLVCRGGRGVIVLGLSGLVGGGGTGGRCGCLVVAILGFACL